MVRWIRSERIRIRVGKVSVYWHHAAWWMYFREFGRQVRKRVGSDRGEAERLAAQIHARLVCGSQSPFAFDAVPLSVLRASFLDYHQTVLSSSPATVGRYRTATLYLERFAELNSPNAKAHQIDATRFVQWLREQEVAPNGHPHSPKRPLRDKGILFILETCRGLMAFALKRRHLPPGSENPFAAIPFERLKVEDAKPIVVFDANAEERFLRSADAWDFAIHAIFAKTGLRVGELCHLLVDDVDLEEGWLHIRNKPDLGWKTKTRSERSVPLLPELVRLLESVIRGRTEGPVFRQRRLELGNDTPLLSGSRAELAKAFARRYADRATRSLSASRSFWSAIGALDGDDVRRSFARVARKAGILPTASPKSWRHSFATLLQEGNIDPLIRQLVMGHSTGYGGGLGMTAHYTHTRSETMRVQIDAALRRWPKSLALIEAHGRTPSEASGA